mmetsp:Transcript_90266/g.244685  ORF Transcript_90266/g.244685 Transcript_90266/m.244685 type:complete len:202 (-) Transcript_90266:201-806(-)
MGMKTEASWDIPGPPQPPCQAPWSSSRQALKPPGPPHPLATGASIAAAGEPGTKTGASAESPPSATALGGEAAIGEKHPDASAAPTEGLPGTPLMPCGTPTSMPWGMPFMLPLGMPFMCAHPFIPIPGTIAGPSTWASPLQAVLARAQSVRPRSSATVGSRVATASARWESTSSTPVPTPLAGSSPTLSSGAVARHATCQP